MASEIPLENKDGENSPDTFSIVESPEEKKARRRSHCIIYITIFLQIIGFSIVITGIFPYLKMLENNPHLSKTYLGWVIAANPLGTMIFSPIFGYASNKLGSVRNMLYLSVLVYCIGNLIYGLLPYFIGFWDGSAYHLMLLSRFISGISVSSLSVGRTYLASSSTIEERTRVMSFSSIAGSTGFLTGPALQVIVSLIIPREDWQYQGVGILAVIFGLFNFIILTPKIFKEYDLAAEERKHLKSQNPNDSKLLPKPDVLAIISLLSSFFAAQYTYILVEILMEPFVQDNYAWCDHMAVVIVGFLLFAFGGYYAIIVYFAGKIAKHIDERKMLLFAFVLASFGFFLLIPWGPGDIPYCEPETHFNLSSISKINEENIGIIFNRYCSNVTECLGCPPQQEWCKNTPQLPFIQYIVSFTLILSACPFGYLMPQTILSKLLGPRPQGTWMGIISSVGSSSRALSPLFVSYVYTSFGTRYIAICMIIAMLIAFIIPLLLYDRLSPIKPNKR